MSTNKVPKGYVIAKIIHKDKEGHDFMKKADVDRIKLVYGKKDILVEVVHDEEEEYDTSIVGERDPEQLRRISSVKMSALNATKPCCN